MPMQSAGSQPARARRRLARPTVADGAPPCNRQSVALAAEDVADRRRPAVERQKSLRSGLATDSGATSHEADTSEVIDLFRQINLY